jgi:hypothetical protein
MLTKKQLKVFDFISAFIHEHRYAPSLRQIADGCPLASTYLAHTYVRRIVDKGFLKKLPNTPHGLEIVKYPLGATLPSTQTQVTLTKDDDIVRAAYARGVRAGKALMQAAPDEQLAKMAYKKGFRDGKASVKTPATIAEAFERGRRQGRAEQTREKRFLTERNLSGHNLS